MSPIQAPHKACFPLGNPFQRILPKGSSLSPELSALLSKFEETLTERLITLKPIHKDDVFSIPWMSLALNLLSETHSDIKSLFTELELPVYDWKPCRDKWRELEICLFMCLSDRLFELRHVSRNLELEGNSGYSAIDLLQVESSIDSWRKEIASGNSNIESCIPVIEKLMGSLALPKVKKSDKGKVFMRAMYGVKMVSLFVCTVFVYALSGSNKKLIDFPVSRTPLWSEAFDDLQACVYGEIGNLMTGGGNVFLKELEAVDISVNELYPIIVESKDPVDSKAFRQLSTVAEKLSSGFDLLSEEVDDICRILLSGREALACNL